MSAILPDHTLVAILAAAQNATPDSHYPLVLVVPFMVAGEKGAVQFIRPPNINPKELAKAVAASAVTLIDQIPSP